jgi:hypothetical protein
MSLHDGVCQHYLQPQAISFLYAEEKQTCPATHAATPVLFDHNNAATGKIVL